MEEDFRRHLITPRDLARTHPPQWACLGETKPLDPDDDILRRHLITPRDLACTRPPQWARLGETKPLDSDELL
jgi:hypothetical protein